MSDSNIWVGTEHGEFIIWHDFDPNETLCFDIDPWIKEQTNFWNQLETECERECCGIYAFSFTDRLISKVQSSCKNLLGNLRDLEGQLEKTNLQVVSSALLNQNMHKNTCLSLIKYLRSTIEANSKN